MKMFRIKKLYLFMLQRFLPLLVMTFFICLFIVMMQFLWARIDDLVGKGLEISVIAELFFYAALTMIPLALPLAILLASLMVFGNLGEWLELTALKASGVSLLRIMSPLIIFVGAISVGAFFFQNDVLPQAQVKMWTLIFSMRQKSPELEIPEGSFYSEIEGYNIYVKQKDRESGMLYGVMIYDVTDLYGNANIIVADSGKLSFSEDQKHLFLKLYSGESFEDLQSGSRSTRENKMYRRENFTSKEILISFDANFNMIDENLMRSQYVGKNITELRESMDSINYRLDSIGSAYSAVIRNYPLIGVHPTITTYNRKGEAETKKNPPVLLIRPLNVDSLLGSGSISSRQKVIADAISRASRQLRENEFRQTSLSDDVKVLRRHDMEFQKKFTLSIACLIFFFIGAPLGSIVRKGGLAVPVVISVMLFVVYFIIDNTGQKMAREGMWEVWEGVWLSSIVLAPLGIWLTYKAVHDSAVFNADSYRNFFTKIVGARQTRNIMMKDIVMDPVVPQEAIAILQRLSDEAKSFIRRYPSRQSYVQYWLKGYSRSEINSLSDALENTVEYMANSTRLIVINKLMDYPVIRKLLLYHPTNYPWLGWAIIVLFPIGLPIYFIGIKQQKILRNDINQIIHVSGELTTLMREEISEKNTDEDATID